LKKVILFGIVVLLLSSCTSLLSQNNQPTQDIQAAIEQTMAVQNAASTIVAQTLSAANVQPTQAPVTENTPVPPTQTLEPTISVMARANQNANCRSGPASNFDYLGVLSQGASATIIGRNTDFGIWWKVSLPDGTECWIVEDAISISGETKSIPTLVSPKTPTPIPAPNWNGKWTIWMSGGTYNPDKEMITFVTNMKQVGQTLTFNYNAWGDTFYFSGTVSSDGMTVNGNEYSEGGYGGDAYFVRNPSNLNQFRGKWFVNGDRNSDGTYCGSMNGAPMPQPCRP